MSETLPAARPGRIVRARSGWLLAAAWVLAAALPAQDEPAFVAAYQQAVGAEAAGRVAAAHAASDRFLALPAGPARTRQLAAGAHAALLAERWALAIDLANEARAAGAEEPRVVQCHLTALLRSGRFAAFVDQAQRDLAVHPAPVRAVLVAEERELLPRAEKALRTGDTARGRFVFTELAAIEPAASHRLGNYALCLRQLGERTAARQVYEQARQLAPDDLELENDYGLFLRATGDLEGAIAAFTRAWQLDLARPEPLRARGPAVTNLVHLQATRPGSVPDPLPAANTALAVRPDATMLKRLVLDVALARLADAAKRP